MHVPLIVFASGFACLVYEVLWMRQAGLLFGATSQAAATTFAAFFAGLAAGGRYWGRRAAASPRPLWLVAGLEGSVAITALLSFAVVPLFQVIYPWLAGSEAGRGWLVAVRFLLTLLLVFPPAFFMGGTIPVIVHHRVGRSASFGATVPWLYAINTLGAAAGAAAAGFWLPLQFGFTGTCLIAMAATLTAAAAALLAPDAVGAWQPAAASETAQPFGNGSRSRRRRQPTLPSPAPVAVTGAPRLLLPLCFLSGFGLLALEVVWMRIFAQLLDNSVYTFAAILVVVLLCLAVGALVASWLARIESSPFQALTAILLAGGAITALTPWIVMQLTNSFEVLASRGTWAEYVMLTFGTVLAAVGPSAIALGTLFPFLLRLAQHREASAGAIVGTLFAVNTIGAIAGSLAGGFVLLEIFGMWRTMQLIAVTYLVATCLVPIGHVPGSWAMRAAAVTAILLALTLLDPSRLPSLGSDPLRRQQQVLETWEGSDCTVTALAGADGVSLQINSHYGLGSTGAAPAEQLQATIPLLAYPRAENLFFLGVGTGITAGAALDPQFPQVRRVVACELVPEVIDAARRYIAGPPGDDLTGGLFRDPRATVLCADGRHELMAARTAQFDIVNADLFVPFRSGAGSLYSLEHFRTVRERLAPGGVFVQWLPLYQVTEREFGTIARTMLEAFETVSLWRNTFQPGDEVVALMGHAPPAPVPAASGDSVVARQAAVTGRTHHDLDRLALPLDAETILFFYCGNLSAAADRFESFPLNTDDHPVIEYLAPRTYRDPTYGAVPWFVGWRLVELVQDLQRRCPPETDPLLASRTTAEKLLPLAAAAYHRARLWAVAGDEESCRLAWNEFVALWTATALPAQVRPGFRGLALGPQRPQTSIHHFPGDSRVADQAWLPESWTRTQGHRHRPDRLPARLQGSERSGFRQTPNR